MKELRGIAKDCFSPVASMYHYLSMSKKYEEKLRGDSIKLKSLFYALRTALAGKWILEYNTVPPVVFSEMLSLVTEDEVAAIRNLIIVKSAHDEAYLHPRNELVMRLISEMIRTNDKYAGSLASGKPDNDRINSFLYKSITK